VLPAVQRKSISGRSYDALSNLAPDELLPVLFQLIFAGGNARQLRDFVVPRINCRAVFTPDFLAHTARHGVRRRACVLRRKRFRVGRSVNMALR
jgi:hypothetical protein